MVKKIIWTPEAEISFDSIISYLESEWSEKEIQNFIERVNKVINQIKIFPNSYPLAGKEDIRGALVTKHNLLLYRIFEESIYLLFFWDTRQNPAKKFDII